MKRLNYITSRFVFLTAALLFTSDFLASAAEPVFRPEKLAEMDAAITEAITDHRCPGGVLWLERKGVSYHKAFGKRALVPAEEAMTEDTIVDAASVTKVCAGTPAIMLLIERGQVQLDAPVQRYIPEFTGDGKETVTVRQLLTHTSGLRGDIETKSDWTGQQTAVRKACEEKLQFMPGTAFRYSDINFFLLGDVVKRVSGMGLEQFVAQEIYQPLKMHDTGFLPPAARQPRIAPTQRLGTNWLRGTVHDPTSRYMGGVAGHAGLFGTAAAVAAFARLVLRTFRSETRLGSPSLIRRFATRTGVAGSSRALGWDTALPTSSCGTRMPATAIGHTGFTGTSLWIDVERGFYAVLLTNRVHPTRTNEQLIALRPKLHDALPF
jgi:CubicO group peptidase (beta-lactamase class C family)